MQMPGAYRTECSVFRGAEAAAAEIEISKQRTKDNGAREAHSVRGCASVIFALRQVILYFGQVYQPCISQIACGS